MLTGHIYMATSLDGFVARNNHSLDWLMKQKIEGEDHGFDDFMDSVNGIIMGSGSFKNVLTLGPWPYKKPVIVMSRSLVDEDIPTELKGKVRLTQLSQQELMLSLEKEGWKRAYVDGGKLVQSFIRSGLIQDMTITSIPILIGDGLRLFGPVDNDIDLELTKSESFSSGLVQNHYKIL
ncbi:MAG: dihydrofolate reductase [Magnetococcales bacterium]|nr:dihydrofolate reductase [Magnetococcales bacterium]